MKFFYDTEFIEDGRTIDLISIGIIAEDGSEYYAVNASAPWARIYRHTWLRENVLPSLPLRQGADANLILLDTTNPHVKGPTQIAHDVALFLRGPDAPWSPVELWAWYGAYDHVALCQLFGAMIDLPEGLPMWTNDLRQTVHTLGITERLPEQPAGHHNALADAQHLKARWDYGVERGWWS